VAEAVGEFARTLEREREREEQRTGSGLDRADDAAKRMTGTLEPSLPGPERGAPETDAPRQDVPDRVTGISFDR
jgi:hypothetical protein